MKKNTTKINPTFDSQELTEDNINNMPDFESQESVDLPASFRQDALNWLETTNLIDQSYTATLYKYDKKFRKRKLYQATYHDEIPDLETIANTYKSGRYNIMISFPQALKSDNLPIKSYIFWIDEHFDNVKSNVGINAPVQIGNDNNGMGQAFGVIERLLCLIVPLIQTGNKQNDNPEKKGNFIANVYDGVNKVMQKNMIDNFKMVNDLTRERMEIPETIEDSENEEPPGIGDTILNMIAPMIQPYVTKILGGGVDAKKAINTVKKNQVFQQLLKSKNEKKLIIDHLISTIGEKKTDQVLKNLGLNRG